MCIYTHMDVTVFKEISMTVIGNLASMFAVMQIYNPPKPSTYSHSRQVIMVTTIEGDMIATKTFLPFATESCPRTPKWIIFSHGNSDDIGSCSSYCQWLADSLSCHVVVYDYVGYGVSCNEHTSVDNMHFAIEAVYGYCIASHNVEPHDIFLMGKSLGSVPTVHLAAQAFARNIAGVVLISPLASGARVVLGKRRLSASVMSMLDDQFAPNVKLVKNIAKPVFVIHGTMDKLINIQNGHDLIDALPGHCSYPPLWLQSGHNDVESVHPGLFISSISTFLQHCTNNMPMDVDRDSEV